MNKKMNGVAIAVLVVLAGLGVWAAGSALSGTPASSGQPQASSTTTQIVTSVTYFCRQGTIGASYSNGSVMLALSDGRSLSLPRAQSGSGIRYEQGTTSFSSEGNDAFLTEGGTMTYGSCVAGTASSASGITSFVDGSKSFSVAYPSAFQISAGEIGYTQSWSQQATTSGLTLAVVSIPQSFQPKTNFSEGKFTVGTSADADAVASCLAQPASGGPAPKKGVVVMVNGVPFTKFSFSDAGAGNLYETTTYRAVRDGQCYAVEYTIHSTNLGNYSADQHVSQFSKSKVQAALEGIVGSFKFLAQ